MSSQIIVNTAEIVRDRTMGRVKEEERFGIDPITILMLISIMIGVIRIIQECRKNKLSSLSNEEKVRFIHNEIKINSNNLKLIQKHRVKRLIRQNLTRDQNKIYGEPLFKTLMELGQNIKEEQVSALLEYKNV